MDPVRERYRSFALISNEAKSPVTALRLYRMYGVIGKALRNIREHLNLRRTLTSSESSLEDKFSVESMALTYLSYIKKKMEEAGLFLRHMMQELSGKLDVTECFQEPRRTAIQGEILKK